MIRILRLMEYEFENYESAETHMANWAVPANGIKNWGKGSIRSSILIIPTGEAESSPFLTTEDWIEREGLNTRDCDNPA